MVNGNTARALYFGAYAVLLVVILGMLALSMTDRSIPTEISAIVPAIMGFILGAHIKAPDTEGTRKDGEG